ncbi:flippase [Planomicrobium sp. CPCC 101110]|uniref:flippase n=1 Tax=Planomicrobium sp. CPCC 101110 TaxID=2599619 RepID=UPI0011B6705C|nr:flippase [Planomicrobium sp. CPCC 101110]TWT27723.1 flippase [Planomicrobium sp. CPCC 101110]
MINILKAKNINRSDFKAKLVESFFGKVSFILFTMVFSLVCTRLYGAELFGQYTYAFSIITLLMIFAKAGFDNSLVYYIPKSGNKYISFSFLVNAAVSFILVLISMFFIWDHFVRVMLPLIWLVSVEQIFFGIYRANGNLKKYYYINGFLSLVIRILIIISFYFIFGKNFVGIVVGVYFSYLLSNFLYFLQNRHIFGKVAYDKQYLSYSLSLVLAAVMGVAMDRVDIIMLGNMTNMENVGIYQIAIQVANILFMVLVIFDTVFGPQISNLFHTNKLEELRNLYVKSTRILGLISLIFFTTLLLGSPIALSLFGPEFIEGKSALIMRSFGQFINVAVGSVWLMLAMTGRPKFHIYANLTAFSINIILNYMLIPKYGVDGAAFSTMLSMVLVNLIGYVMVSKVFKLKVYKYF